MPEVARLTRETHETFVRENRIAAVLFDAPAWDIYHRIIRPHLDNTAEELGNFAGFGFVDTDDTTMWDICRSVPISNVPNVAYYKDGLLLASLVGVHQDIAGRVLALLEGRQIGSDDGFAERPHRDRSVFPMLIRESQTDLDISGHPAELNALADKIVKLAGSGVGETLFVPADRTNPVPYDRCLAGMVVRIGEGPVQVAVDQDRIVVCGSASMIRIFANYFRFDPKTQRGIHNHHEWFEGNEYVANDSRPLVISVR
jgi:hypothetical protein